MDNAPGHPSDLDHPNVKIEKLPKNSTSLIQPLDQDIISAFKAHYLRLTMQWVLDTIESKSTDVPGAWSFSI